MAAAGPGIAGNTHPPTYPDASVVHTSIYTVSPRQIRVLGNSKAHQ
eukprot:COSAG04_NODE_15036_length_546_cov_0.881432_2_plen_45_part_01